jgi:hypothetical protein
VSMRVLRWSVPAAVAVLFSCSSPTDGCACPPARTHAVIYGTLTDAVQQPVAGWRVQATIYGPVCGQGPAQITITIPAPPPTDADGRYRLHLVSSSGHGSACVQVSAREVEDSTPPPVLTPPAATVTAAVPMRWEREPPDSVRIDIRLP